MKRFLFYILIVVALVGTFTAKTNAQTTQRLGTCTFTNGRAPETNQTEPSCNLIGGVEGGSTWRYTHTGIVDRLPNATDYKFLAPLPCTDDTGANCTNGKLESFNSTSPNALGNYINLLIKLIIGISAVMAVVMIVIGGVEYMTSELISGKEAGKERITHAVFGLLLALGAWALLNTINPKLLNTNINIEPQTVEVKLTADTANFAITEKKAAAVGTGYKLNGVATTGVANFVQNNKSLTEITVDTTSRTASFCNGSSCVTVPVGLGYKGVSEIGQAQGGDFKTPKGTTVLSGTRLVGTNGNAVIANGYNFGAAFINIGASINGVDRGIGFHGNSANTLETTAGCIRMTNDDLAALAPYMVHGVRVIIK